MENDDQFNLVARRDTELTALAVRGRRRAIEIVALLCLPWPFVIMKLNNDSSLSSIISIDLALLGRISYSWAKWKRRSHLIGGRDEAHELSPEPPYRATRVQHRRA